MRNTYLWAIYCSSAVLLPIPIPWVVWRCKMRSFRATVGLLTLLISLSTAQFLCKLQHLELHVRNICTAWIMRLHICAYKLCAALVCRHYSLLNRQIRLHAHSLSSEFTKVILILHDMLHVSMYYWLALLWQELSTGHSWSNSNLLCISYSHRLALLSNSMYS